MKVKGWAAHAPGKLLAPMEYELAVDAPRDVLVKVERCGLCHSDIHMVDNDWRITRYPIVPGHEIVGTVLEKGGAVEGLQLGQRVGIGWQASACMTCPDCLSGNENLCDHSQGLIVAGKGGFAEVVAVDGRFVFPLPDNLPSETTGPLLCGGVTVYSALRAAGMTSGQNIGIIGLGGLGHLAVLFAARLANSVTVFTGTEAKARLARELGAEEVLVVSANDPAPRPTRRLALLLVTVPQALDWEGYIQWLGSDGTMVLVAANPVPLQVPVWALLGKRRRIMASPIGGRATMREMLEVAARLKIAPMVETYPLGEVNKAIERLRQNQVRFRAVLEV